jgi:hypothetical protein
VFFCRGYTLIYTRILQGKHKGEDGELLYCGEWINPEYVFDKAMTIYKEA